MGSEASEGEREASTRVSSPGHPAAASSATSKSDAMMGCDMAESSSTRNASIAHPLLVFVWVRLACSQRIAIKFRAAPLFSQTELDSV